MEEKPYHSSLVVTVANIGKDFDRLPLWTFFKRFLLPWVILSSLPFVCLFVLVQIPMSRVEAISVVVALYCVAVVLSLVLVTKSPMRDDTRILFYALSFVSPFLFFGAFIFTLVELGLFEAT